MGPRRIARSSFQWSLIQLKVPATMPVMSRQTAFQKSRNHLHLTHSTTKVATSAMMASATRATGFDHSARLSSHSTAVAILVTAVHTLVAADTADTPMADAAAAAPRGGISPGWPWA